MGDSEHAAWARRLLAIRPRLQGPVYFLWGTDWEDAPAVNAGRLQAALPREVAFDWPAFVRRAPGGRPSIAELFAASPAAAKVGAAAAASGRSAPCLSLSPPLCMDSAADWFFLSARVLRINLCSAAVTMITRSGPTCEISGLCTIDWGLVATACGPRGSWMDLAYCARETRHRESIISLAHLAVAWQCLAVLPMHWCAAAAACLRGPRARASSNQLE